jgi:hypothetical protein
VEIDWASIAKNNFHPFKLLYWQLGRRGITSPEYQLPEINFDFQEITLFLSTEGIGKPKVKFPELKIHYKSSTGGAKTLAVGESYELQNAGLRTESELSQQIVRIGDRFTYRLKIIRAKNVSDSDFKPEEVDFWPLKVSKLDITSRNLGAYAIDEYAWTLASYYLILEPFPLPKIEINWKDSFKKSHAEIIAPVKIAMVPTLGPADGIMSVWDSGLLLWPRKSDYLKIVLPIAAGGLTIIVFLGVWSLKRILSWLKVIRADPVRLFRKNRRRAKRLLRKLVNGKTAADEDSLTRLLSYLKVLIGLNFGMKPEKARALSARELEVLVSTSTQIRLIGDLLEEGGNKLLLSKFELMLFSGNAGSIDRAELDKILKRFRLFLSHIQYLPRT